MYYNKKIEEDAKEIIEKYKKEIEKIPSLSREEEKKLGHKILEKDKESIQLLAYYNMAVVIDVTLELYLEYPEISPEDIIAEGNVALIEAAYAYDVRNRYLFSTFARKYILKYLLKTLPYREVIQEYAEYPSYREVGDIQDVSVKREYKIYKKIEEVTDKFLKEIGRKPTLVEISFILQIPIDSAEQILAFFPPIQSIEESNLEELIIDRRNENPEKFLVKKEWKKELEENKKRNFDYLSSKPKEVMELYFQGKNSKEIAALTGLSLLRVRMIEIHFLKCLKNGIPKEPICRRKEEVSYTELMKYIQGYTLSTFLKEHKAFRNEMEMETNDLLVPFFETHKPSKWKITEKEKKEVEREVIYVLTHTREYLPPSFTCIESLTLETMNAMQAKFLLLNHHFSFSKKARNILQIYYHLPDQTLMSVADKNKVKKLLSPVCIKDQKEQKNK